MRLIFHQRLAITIIENVVLLKVCSKDQTKEMFNNEKIIFEPKTVYGISKISINMDILVNICELFSNHPKFKEFYFFKKQ